MPATFWNKFKSRTVCLLYMCSPAAIVTLQPPRGLRALHRFGRTDKHPCAVVIRFMLRMQVSNIDGSSAKIINFFGKKRKKLSEQKKIKKNHFGKIKKVNNKILFHQKKNHEKIIKKYFQNRRSGRKKFWWKKFRQKVSQGKVQMEEKYFVVYE